MTPKILSSEYPLLISAAHCLNNKERKKGKVGTKDYIEKVDFQELIFAIVNWPNSELYGAFVGIMLYLDQSATS